MWDDDGAVGAVLGAGVSIGGGIAGAIASAKQAAKQRDFQKHVLKNRYQWQMRDMRKAGLNPILASGASPPMASGAAATIPNVAQGAVSSAREAATMRTQLEIMKRQASLLQQQNHTELAKQDMYFNQGEKNFAEAQLAKFKRPGAEADAWLKSRPEWKWKLYADAALETASSASDLVLPWKKGLSGIGGRGPLRPDAPGPPPSSARAYGRTGGRTRATPVHGRDMPPNSVKLNDGSWINYKSRQRWDAYGNPLPWRK